MATRKKILGMLAALSAFSAPAAAEVAVCLNAGVQYKLGEYACIAACHGQRRLARCDAVSTRTTWTYISDACPSAMINPEWPSDWTEIPAVAAMSPIPLVVNSSAIVPAVAPRIKAATLTMARLATR